MKLFKLSFFIFFFFLLAQCGFSFNDVPLPDGKVVMQKVQTVCLKKINARKALLNKYQCANKTIDNNIALNMQQGCCSIYEYVSSSEERCIIVNDCGSGKGLIKNNSVHNRPLIDNLIWIISKIKENKINIPFVFSSHPDTDHNNLFYLFVEKLCSSPADTKVIMGGRPCLGNFDFYASQFIQKGFFLFYYDQSKDSRYYRRNREKWEPCEDREKPLVNSEITMLNDYFPKINSSNSNDYSILTAFRHVIIGGDATKTTLLGNIFKALQNMSPISYPCFYAFHHGAQTGGSASVGQDLAESLKAYLLMVSVGATSPYGHPVNLKEYETLSSLGKVASHDIIVNGATKPVNKAKRKDRTFLIKPFFSHARRSYSMKFMIRQQVHISTLFHH